MIDRIMIEGINVMIPLELLYWNEEAIIGHSEEIKSHIPVIKETLGFLSDAGYDIIAAVGGNDAEGLCGNGNMYVLFRGAYTFDTLPRGFVSNYLLLADSAMFSLICPDVFNSSVTKREMQDYLTEKASILREWASQVEPLQ